MKALFLRGFYGNIDLSCILHVEILALYHGLDLCWSTGYRRVICYSDSLHVIMLVQDLLNMFHKFSNLISLIKKLLSQDWIVALCHILWEGNFVADCLAKLDAKSYEKLVLLDTTPILTVFCFLVVVF
ncbi:putative ribonuclease H-like domain-containing protein [Medicago truncatula]|uniref:Putative ribonuclease H-like domain-containing protein n=1 Tax=Medicago truncatula TaxID=3880 RepID=A0A396GZF7_MEDTR|nr:putative ribonuclease H-like domain-containing protein [Medicago truncatula]